MREILFRGKPTERFADYPMLRPDLFRDGWVYGSLVVCEDRYYICTHAECSNRTIISNAHGTMIEVIPETVGEYTTLDDRNDRKIFEGDIVKFHKSGVSRSVAFDYGMAELEFSRHDPVDNPDGWCLCCDHGICEIIGNIHDNPELLKGE